MDLSEFYWPDSDIPADELLAIGEVTVHIRERITAALSRADIQNHGPGVWSATVTVDGHAIGATGSSYYDAGVQLVMGLSRHYGLPF